MHNKVGTRIRLLQMADPAAPPVGTEGTITYIDSLGDIGVDWDNGSGLKVVFVAGDEVERVCPKCGKGYSNPPAISREDNKTEICPECGVREAMETVGLEEMTEDVLAKIRLNAPDMGNK